MALPVLRHRIIPTFNAEAAGVSSMEFFPENIDRRIWVEVLSSPIIARIHLVIQSA